MKKIEEKEKVSTHNNKNNKNRNNKNKNFPGLSGSGDPQRTSAQQSIPLIYVN